MRVTPIFVLLICLSTSAGVLADGTVDSSLAGRIEGLLNQVESAPFAQSASALDELRALPIEALPLLESAAASGRWSVDTRQELQAVLKIFRKESKAALAALAQRHRNEACAVEVQAEYDRHGQHGDWDADVHAAIGAAFVTDTPGRQQAPALLAKAKAAGCGDPLVAYLLVSHPVSPLPAPDIVDGLENVPEQLSQQAYSPAIIAAASIDRSKAIWRSMNGRGTTAQRRRCQREVDAAVEALPTAKADAFLNDKRRVDMIQSAAYLRGSLAGPGQAAIDAARQTIDRLTRPDDSDTWKLSIRLTTAARMLALVPEGQDAAALQTFYKSEKKNVLASNAADDPYVMQARHIAAVWANDATEVSALFDKLFPVEPDVLTLCRRQMDFLTRNGEADELQALARRLADSPLSDAAVPQVCAECYWKAGYVQNAFDPAAEMRKHADWWEAIQAVHERYLRRRPNDRMTAARLGWYAFQFEHYDVANQYFKLAGPDQFDPIFGSTTDYNYCMEKAAKFAANGGK